MPDPLDGADSSHRGQDDRAARYRTTEPSERDDPPESAQLTPATPHGHGASEPQQNSPQRQPRRVRSSSIRIQRLPSSVDRQSNPSQLPQIQKPLPQLPPDTEARDHAPQDPHRDYETQGRRRSFSAPERREDLLAAMAAGEGAGSRPTSTLMPMIQEGQPMTPGTPMSPADGPPPANPNRSTSLQSIQTASETDLARPSSRPRRPPLFGRLRSGYRSAAFSDSADAEAKRRSRAVSAVSGAAYTNKDEDDEYQDDVANLLDVVDPEVSTLSTLTNVQNSLFVPDLGRFVNRRPTYKLTSVASSGDDTDTSDEFAGAAELASVRTAPDAGSLAEGTGETAHGRPTSALSRTDSITSEISESRYAVLPHGISLEGWSREDKEALNDHVRHMLHSRRSKIKRSLKGFWKYVQRPLGFLVTLYAFLITVFGLVWVLFLIGWISGGSDARDKYLINIVDFVLVALFAVVGDGLAPFRAVDTYHMIWIALYAHRTWEVRRKQRLPKLGNRNDLPTVTPLDLERASSESQKGEQEVSVLTTKQQQRLAHHQKKFARSHTFYKPHETGTHYAFSIRLLISIVVLLDCHSLLQISLGALTWGWDWHTRPAVVTTVVLICSITCNITAGVLISVGDRRSRKVEVVQQMFRQTLTQEAIKKVEKHKREKEEQQEKEMERNRTAYPGT